MCTEYESKHKHQKPISMPKTILFKIVVVVKRRGSNK